MNVLMAGTTESDTVGNFVAERRHMFPRLNVVSLDVAFITARLARVVVSIVDRLTPTSVPGRVSFLVRLWLALGSVVAFLAAIFGFEMTVGKRELFAAPLTRKHLPFTAPSSLLTSARSGASQRWFGKPNNTPKLFAADNTLDVMARLTNALVGVGGVERLMANVAGDGSNGDGRFVHTSIITQEAQPRKIERWAQHTGREPELVS